MIKIDNNIINEEVIFSKVKEGKLEKKETILVSSGYGALLFVNGEMYAQYLSGEHVFPKELAGKNVVIYGFVRNALKVYFGFRKNDTWGRGTYMAFVTSITLFVRKFNALEKEQVTIDDLRNYINPFVANSVDANLDSEELNNRIVKTVSDCLVKIGMKVESVNIEETGNK